MGKKALPEVRPEPGPNVTSGFCVSRAGFALARLGCLRLALREGTAPVPLPVHRRALDRLHHGDGRGRCQVGLASGRGETGVDS